MAESHPPFGSPLGMGTLLATMRAAWLAVLSLSVGLTGAGTTFFASGCTDSAGWTWLSGATGQPQWQFYDLPWECQYLSVEIFLQTRGWRTPPPSTLCLTFQFSTFTSSLIRKVQLQRVSEKGEYVAYFGQLILARRDLNVGSFLTVKLKGGRQDVEIGVHSSSVRILGEGISFAGPGLGGVGGPLVAGVSGSADPALTFSPFPSRGSESGLEKTFRESAGMEDAAYVSPGRYVGELGWPGPGNALDSQDWLRVNLNVGHLLEARVESPRPVSLSIFNPLGQEVGRVRGLGQIGLTYQAPAPGAYWICISISESVPLFTYTLDLTIRR